MRRLKPFLLLGILLLVLAACGGGTDETIVEEATETVATEMVVPTETALPPTATAVPTETSVPPTETPVPPTETPAPTATPEAVASACVTCHSDREMLVNTAAPVEDEPEEAESSGVG